MSIALRDTVFRQMTIYIVNVKIKSSFVEKLNTDEFFINYSDKIPILTQELQGAYKTNGLQVRCSLQVRGALQVKMAEWLAHFAWTQKFVGSTPIEIQDWFFNKYSKKSTI